MPEFKTFLHLVIFPSTNQKTMLSLSLKQETFEDLKRARPKPKTWASRPNPRPTTSKCVLEAKDVFGDSTSDHNVDYR